MEALDESGNALCALQGEFEFAKEEHQDRWGDVCRYTTAGELADLGSVYKSNVLTFVQLSGIQRSLDDDGAVGAYFRHFQGVAKRMQMMMIVGDGKVDISLVDVDKVVEIKKNGKQGLAKDE